MSAICCQKTPDKLLKLGVNFIGLTQFLRPGAHTYDGLMIEPGVLVDG
jgi:hypothetical protein